MELTREIRDGRIAICQDVIDRIVHHDLFVLSGASYLIQKQCVSTQDSLKIIRSAYKTAMTAQRVVDGIEQYCQVCIRGAMMLSKARVFGDMPMTMIATRLGLIFGTRRQTKEALKEYFNAEELYQIEVAFEVRIMNLSSKVELAFEVNILDIRPDPRELYDWGKIRGAWFFGKTAKSDLRAGSKKRCLAVMKNIVENDGVFTFDSVAISDDPVQETCERSNNFYPDFCGFGV